MHTHTIANTHINITMSQCEPQDSQIAPYAIMDDPMTHRELTLTERTALEYDTIVGVYYTHTSGGCWEPARVIGTADNGHIIVRYCHRDEKCVELYDTDSVIHFPRVTITGMAHGPADYDTLMFKLNYHHTMADTALSNHNDTAYMEHGRLYHNTADEILTRYGFDPRPTI